MCSESSTKDSDLSRLITDYPIDQCQFGRFLTGASRINEWTKEYKGLGKIVRAFKLREGEEHLSVYRTNTKFGIGIRHEIVGSTNCEFVDQLHFVLEGSQKQLDALAQHLYVQDAMRPLSECVNIGSLHTGLRAMLVLGASGSDSDETESSWEELTETLQVDVRKKDSDLDPNILKVQSELGEILADEVRRSLGTSQEGPMVANRVRLVSSK